MVKKGTAASLLASESSKASQQLRAAQKVYKLFEDYLELTQRRVVVRESSATTYEAELHAAVSPTN